LEGKKSDEEIEENRSRRRIEEEEKTEKGKKVDL
jgi:hypothetical protein